jgi:oxygen-independent coproporphyrinogen-3 oxidase
MGYTTTNTQLMIGLGVSSISDSWTAFAQNEKVLEEYYDRLDKNEIPVYRGHILNEEDLIIRRHILNSMCQFETSWEKPEMQFPEINEVVSELKEMESDGLLVIAKNKITVTDKGKPFIRNICMAFDLRLKRRAPQTQLFSLTI